MKDKINPAAPGEGQAGISKSRGNYSKRPTKRETVLAWLIEQSKQGKRVTRFDAEKVGDHVFNSTVSDIERTDGIKVERQATKRPTQFGTDVVCNEYWIAISNLVDAYKVLSSKRARRAT